MKAKAIDVAPFLFTLGAIFYGVYVLITAFFVYFASYNTLQTIDIPTIIGLLFIASMWFLAIIFGAVSFLITIFFYYKLWNGDIK
jgi:hypothetical protein